jgi:phytoene dehydrogenase-like protein
VVQAVGPTLLGIRIEGSAGQRPSAVRIETGHWRCRDLGFLVRDGTKVTMDAVVIGAGHNGLVAANLLADAGWDVTVLEAQPEAGGAVRSGELTVPGFVHDLFSAFYPLAVASPVLRRLDLESHGLRWCRAPAVLAHPRPDGTCAVLSTDLATTAASLDAFHPGDGDGWRELQRWWAETGGAFIDSLLAPFPPVRGPTRLAARLGPSGLLRLARLALIPVRRLADEQFKGPGGGLLLTGCALHADFTPESAGSGLMGWLLTCLGQEHGFPVPQGGAARLTDALVRRLEGRGGRLQCATPVERILLRGGEAVGVRTADGREIRARRAVVADVGAPALYLGLIGAEHLPPPLIRALERFQYDSATVKVDWALDGPIPWVAKEARRAGTVHTGDDLDHLTQATTELAMGRIPARPPLIIGQMTTTDPSRSPPGTETVWAYTHVPQQVRSDAGGTITGRWDAGETEEFVARVEDEIERLAPGFAGLVRGRHVFVPPTLEAADSNLVGGAINGGTAQLHQQLVLRPVPGLGRAETPFARLFLASASAHPGGGVHGACGANAARAALAPGARLRASVVRRLAGA